jgi:hypothetical protein
MAIRYRGALGDTVFFCGQETGEGIYEVVDITRNLLDNDSLTLDHLYTSTLLAWNKHKEYRGGCFYGLKPSPLLVSLYSQSDVTILASQVKLAGKRPAPEVA